MLAFFSKLFKGKDAKVDITEASMKKFLIVGLGNIGPKYEETRHNIGFKILDTFAQAQETTWSTDKLGDIAQIKIKARPVILLKPNTYMNLSGKAVRYWMQKEKISLENLLIVTDDLNLDFGTIRIKTKGSDGGHNGLKDIQNQLMTSNYNRFRFGIGDRFSKGKQIDYVLGEWDAGEQKDLPERLDTSSKAISSFISEGINTTMNTYNGN
ncbi:MAG TPA: aminoacyl-tRNA hydrolase [Leeuwenhoekiella sp.]|nr:aminoacyl-tRNA hydrolase [Leeuwenhoekiella sp.]